MRHIISILLENEAGALSRVSGLFSARAYNIASLTVAPTDDPTISRITVVAQGEDAVVQQIIKQLNKLVDVIGVMDLTDNEHFEREIMLVKVAPKGAQKDRINVVIQELAARQLEQNESMMTLEITNIGLKLNEAIEKLKPFNVIEVVRSGAVGIGSGDSVLKI
jgi:acetolactate synthase-1/3 small subunit